MNCVQKWPEPVTRVQSLSESGIRKIPDRYVSRPFRPSLTLNNITKPHSPPPPPSLSPVVTSNIPVIDLAEAFSGDPAARAETMRRLSAACKDWGFFQVVNHGVDLELMTKMREIWREFFNLPLGTKQIYSNDPVSYEGYGSRLGVEKGAILDWSDYFFLHYLPARIRNPGKWPEFPDSCRDLVGEYGKEVAKLGGKLMKIFSSNLGLEEDGLQDAFGGEDFGGCLRVNFYPKCPQPDLTLGLSPHSDPGGMTILLPDENVSGLQVLKSGNWVTVKPVANAFIINIGDQIQVLSNAIYKSVEHRVIVNSAKDRVSLAFFYNPRGDLQIGPSKELVKADQPALYPSMTFNEYRLFIRTKGPCGKQQVESFKSPCTSSTGTSTRRS
ncbi:Jasmonate-induced oxygenase 1 [Linum grandiflorum]